MDLLRIRAEGLYVHGASGHHDQMSAVLPIESIQVRLVLKEVGIELALLHLQERLYIVGEDLDAQVDPLRAQLRLDELENLGMRNGRGRDRQGLRVAGGGCGSGAEEGKTRAQESEHGSWPLGVRYGDFSGG